MTCLNLWAFVPASLVKPFESFSLLVRRPPVRHFPAGVRAIRCGSEILQDKFQAFPTCEHTYNCFTLPTG